MWVPVPGVRVEPARTTGLSVELGPGRVGLTSTPSQGDHLQGLVCQTLVSKCTPIKILGVRHCFVEIGS